VPEALDLLAVRHQIQIVKPGFREYAATITPRPGFPLVLKVQLHRPDETETPGIIAAANGYRLQLVRPGPFQMGSSRAEPGRRANESQQTVQMVRPFYMGLQEVTNAEFRAFQAGHDAGTIQSESLNRDDQPAANLTWQQAAAFCNWLSRRQGLAPVYVAQGETLVAQSPLGNGYRLPTEAEWAYCARFDPAGQTHRYPWGDGFPPPARAANIADRSARGILENYLDNYEDGYPAAAPPGRFSPNPMGLHDLGGNVAEWCHDIYAIAPPAPGQIATDPSGAEKGRMHVIRGGSWRLASPQTLRTAYRDYLDGRRADLGFRIARYAEREGGSP
jgi:formylglycine-generating enzyme required for sulfatase activity